MEQVEPAIKPMSDYEQQAWEEAIARLQTGDSGGVRVPKRVAQLSRQAGGKAVETWDRLPGSEAAEEAMRRALVGLQAIVFEPALNSVNVDKVVRGYTTRHPQVQSLSNVRLLDLEQCDARLPKARIRYTVGSAAQGGATALAVTGAVVSTTVSGGTTAAAAIGAVAADTVATMATMGRIIAVVASRYGYDVKQPSEEIFAMGVMSLASAGTEGGKVAAMTSLSRLTQEMMRQATWSQLRRHQLVKVIERVYLALGLKLTQAKLAQTVPVAGVLINAGLTAELTNRTFRRATDAYRLRFLSDKYGLNPADWLTKEDMELQDREAVPRIDQVVEDVVADESEPRD